jgi:hypothetical protein
VNGEPVPDLAPALLSLAVGPGPTAVNLEVVHDEVDGLRHWVRLLQTRADRRALPFPTIRRRIAANHRHASLLWPVIQPFGCSGPRLFLERTGQTLLPRARADLPNGLYRQRDNPGQRRRPDPLGEWQNSQRPPDNSYRLHTSAQRLLNSFWSLAVTLIRKAGGAPSPHRR